jgi:hypothetical protein
VQYPPCSAEASQRRVGTLCIAKMLALMIKHALKHIYAIFMTLVLFSCTNNENDDKSTVSEEPQTEKTTNVKEQNSAVSRQIYELGNIQVELTQIKSDGKNFYCKSKLVTSRDQVLMDSISFIPEPVGGFYGISKPNRFANHLVFTKFGDYDGRTILVNDKGRILNIIGGENYVDSASKLLFTIYDSDVSGFAVFNLTSDSTLLEMSEIEDRPISFHKAFGERYFMLSSNDETEERDKSVWEIEFELERIMQVDLDTNQINQSNILSTWTSEEVFCECEE